MTIVLAAGSSTTRFGEPASKVMFSWWATVSSGLIWESMILYVLPGPRASELVVETVDSPGDDLASEFVLRRITSRHGLLHVTSRRRTLEIEYIGVSDSASPDPITGAQMRWGDEDYGSYLERARSEDAKLAILDYLDDNWPIKSFIGGPKSNWPLDDLRKPGVWEASISTPLISGYILNTIHIAALAGTFGGLVMIWRTRRGRRSQPNAAPSNA
jgi:hypothetical protein